MYIRRHADTAVKKLAKMFSAVLVTGPRQVGKTTLLKKITKADYISLDDPILLASARQSGTTFFKDNPPPLFIDEVQKAPELFPQIKMVLDKERKKGMFYLCGSRQFQMMENVSESLAGRLGILTLPGLSLRELTECNFTDPFLPTDIYFKKRRTKIRKITYAEIWEIILRGSMPQLCANKKYSWQSFYSSYVNTYIKHDVLEIARIGSEIKFMQFMTAMAARTGQLLNLQSVARDVGVTQPTADRWLSILRSSNIVYLLQPYHTNRAKRALKTPKIYFLDTGLAAYLTKWNTADALKNGAMAGAFFETFVIAEILKSYYNSGISEPALYFYRDQNSREIDLLIEDGDTVYPIEIKKHADPSKRDTRTFNILDKLKVKRGNGGVICLYDNLVSLTEKDRAIPVEYL